MFEYIQNPKAFIFLSTTLMLVGACGTAPSSTTVYDPAETQNRAMHNVNVALDDKLFRGMSNVYGKNVPTFIRDSLRNFDDHIDLPTKVVNDLLQLQFKDALTNTTRFVVNATFGLAGFRDPATEMGLLEQDTDFGETLYVWGVGEGAYHVIPIKGPSNERDTAGWVADWFLDPLDFLSPTNIGLKLGLIAIDGLNKRYEYRDVVEALYHESADGYTQTRLSYLQNRRYELGQTVQNEEDYFDPYEDVVNE